MGKHLVAQNGVDTFSFNKRAALVICELSGQLSAFVGAERPGVPGVYAADLLAARKYEGFNHACAWFP